MTAPSGLEETWPDESSTFLSHQPSVDADGHGNQGIQVRRQFQRGYLVFDGIRQTTEEGPAAFQPLVCETEATVESHLGLLRGEGGSLQLKIESTLD